MRDRTPGQADVSYRDRVELMASIATRLLDSDGTDPVAGEVLAELAEPLRIDLLLRYAVEEPGVSLRLAGHAGLPESLLEGLARIGWAQGVCGRAAAEGCPQTFSHVQSSRDEMLAMLRAIGVRAYSCYPLFSRGRLMGTVSFGSTSIDAFPADSVTLMRAVANLLAVAAGRQRAERELRESESRLRWVVENSREGFYRRDLVSGRYDYLSPGIESILGYRAEELMRMGVDEVLGRMHPDDQALLPPALEEAERTGRLHVEYRFRRKDGEVRWVEDTAAVVHEDGRPAYRGGVVRDITERKAAQAAELASRRSTEQLELALDSAQQGTWEFDFAADEMYWDRRAGPLFGLEADERMPVSRILSMIHEDDRAAVEDAVQHALDPAGDGVFRVEHRAVWPDGSVHWIVGKGQAHFEGEDAARRAVRFAGIVMDVTDRHSVETVLRETTRRLAEANRLKDEFLATLSHELRTPLNAVLGWSKILVSGRPDPDTARRGLEAIARNAEAQAQLVADVLDVSRIVSGKLRLQVQQTELARVMRAALDSVLPAAEAKGVRIETRFAAESTTVSGDPDRLQQVFWNLLSNAVKFTPSGGRVVVAVEREGSQVAARVSDTGAGIEPLFLPHVFERFTQADTSTRRKHGGLGLGLALVRHLVELHGGTVEAESAGPGRGAAFTVHLPLRAVSGSPAPPPADAPRAETGEQDMASLEDVRVLVVDDEPDARELVSEVLGARGAQVVVAASAGEALERLRRQDFDVLLADIGMPGEDGFELIRKVRLATEPELLGLPAAALTAYSRAEDVQRARAAGFDAHISKPVTPAALVAGVRKLADR